MGDRVNEVEDARIFGGEGKIGEEKFKDLQIAAMNVNGLGTSWAEFNEFIAVRKPELILVSETRRTEAQLKAKHKIKGYRWIGADYYHRGFACLVSDTLGVEIWRKSESQEALLLKVHVGDRDIFIGGGYAPQTGSAFFKTLHKWVLELDPSECFVLMGDFNARSWAWDCKENSNGRRLRQLLPLWGGSVFEDGPTCFRVVGQSTVDLLITNEPDLISNFTTGGDLNSDHCPISASLNLQMNEVESETQRKTLDFQRADWNIYRTTVLERLDWKLLKKLVQDWLHGRWRRDSKLDLNRLVSGFEKALIGSAKINIPEKNVKVISNARPYWWSEDLSNLLTRKERLCQEWRLDRNYTVKRRLDAMTKKVRKLEQCLRSSSWRSFCDNFQDPKQLFSLFRKSKGGSSVPAFMDNKGKICVSDKEKSEGFNSSYADIGNEPLADKPHHNVVSAKVERARARWNRKGWIKVPTVYTDKILNSYVMALKEGSAPGLDGIRNIMVKNLPPLAVLYLSRVFQLLHASGYCPKQWKLACLFPIPKGGDIFFATDLRPIALTSVLGKLFERVLCDCLTKAARAKGLIPHEQNGFMSGKETLGITTRLAQRLRKLKANSVRAGLFLDVKKAYNSVWHQGLIYKLMTSKVPEHITRWISAWLQDRTYVTKIGAAVSSEMRHERGVPQGSVLSPMLFILYFSDIVKNLGSESFIFADDLTLITRPFKPGKRLLFTRLQKDVRDIMVWGEKWMLNFQPTKTKLVIFSRSKYLQRGDYCIKMGPKVLKPQRSAQCLGVIFDQEFRFHEECEARLRKFQKRIGFVTRIGGYKFGCPPRYLIQLFASVCLPTLLYNSWTFLLGPKKYLLRASSIQRQALRRFLSLPCCSGGDVVEMYCNVKPLVLRCMQLTANMGVRLNSGRDVLYKNEYKEYIESMDFAKEAARKVATWKTPFGVIATTLHSLGVPFLAKGKPKCVGILPVHKRLHHPSMPSFHKDAGQREQKKAAVFGHQIIDSIPEGYCQIYADGAHNDAFTRAAVHVIIPGVKAFDRCWELKGNHLSSYKAELVSLEKAVRIAIKSRMDCAIVMDSQAVIKSVLNPRSSCTQSRRILRLIDGARSVIDIHWVPSHVGIPGNEHVDLVANQPDEIRGVVRVRPTLKDFKCCVSRALRRAWQSLWDDSTNSFAAHVLFEYIPSKRTHIVGTTTARIMARLRTSYCAVNDFLFRHGLAVQSECSYCMFVLDVKVEDTVGHRLSCPQYGSHVAALHAELDVIMEGQGWSFQEVLDPSLDLALQIRIGNALQSYAFETSEFGII